MQIYISHSSNFDYQIELYAPLIEQVNKDSYMQNRHELVLPHKNTKNAVNTRSLIESADLLLAEISYPSTGQGIELAWASDANIPIYCICISNKSTKISSSIKLLCNNFYIYSSTEELQAIFVEILNSVTL